MTLLEEPLSELSRRLRQREFSAVELTREALRRVEALDSTYGSFLRRTPDLALAAAEKADRRLAQEGEGAPDLCGIPLAVKDVICTKGVETTAASQILRGFVPPYSATVIQRLEALGVVPLGKLNCDEFAMGSSNENSAYQLTRNPWDPERVPGGSSGGSAVAVAARLACASLGSETGGSIRLPASFTGVVGVKPTYGRVSRYGLIPLASSLDQIGPLAKTVEDAALVLQAIAGADPHDSTTIPQDPADYRQELRRGVQGLRLGIPKEYLGMGVEDGVRRVFEDSVSVLRKRGALVSEVSLPATEYALAAYYVITPAEVSSNLARMDGVRFGPGFGEAKTMQEAYQLVRHQGFGEEARRRITLGTYALSSGYYDAYYLRAQKVRTLVAEDFQRVFHEVDAIVSPTAPTAAFRLGERSQDPLAMYVTDILTLPANLAGIAGISVPAGFQGPLPVGLQVLGPYLGEGVCFRVAQVVEEEMGIWRRLPARLELGS
ncbi:MAG: Asp-tRNA(Asn)/Glu-tRNA(Gln) amidotransferase subunit GatA [Candidatus Dormibacteria bacterium]